MSSQEQKTIHIEIARAIKASQESFMLRTELFALAAADMKAKYDALVTAGFTSEQALDLCKAKAL